MAEGHKVGRSLSSEPTLTVDNIIGVIEAVAVDRRKEVWSHLVPDTLLEDIYQSCLSEEQRLHACADIYVIGLPDSSWTGLCWRLFAKKEMTAARKAKTFIPQTDPTLTIENVVSVVEAVAVDRRKEVWSRHVPHTHLEEIYQNYSSEDQRLHACADFYVNCHPESSWTRLSKWLFNMKEVTAARKAKTFIPQTDPTLTVDNVTGVMEKVADGGRENVWRECLGDDLFVDINSKCSSEKELLHTCSDVYVNCHPDFSWEHLARGLYKEIETAAVEEVRSYLNPRDLTLTTERLVELFASVDDENVDRLGSDLNTPSSQSKEFQMNYKDPARRKEAYLDYYVHNNPFASWAEVAEVLHWCKLPEQAAVVENTYVKDHEGTSPHPAIVSEDTGFLIYTTHPGSVCCQMTSDHKIWLGKPTVSTSKLSLPVELTIKDLRMVLRAAWDARSKWYNIGLELEIDPETLNVIEVDNKKTDDCFRAMLTTWLNTVEPKPTSAALADALRSPTVGYVDLAREL